MILLLLCETRQRQVLTALAGNRFLWIHSWGRCGLRPAAPSASSFDFSKKPRGQAPPFPSQNGGLDPTMLVRMLRNVFHALWKNAADWETGQSKGCVSGTRSMASTPRGHRARAGARRPPWVPQASPARSLLVPRMLHPRPPMGFQLRNEEQGALHYGGTNLRSWLNNVWSMAFKSTRRMDFSH